MIAYWLMFLAPVIAFAFPGRYSKGVVSLSWFLIFTFFVLVMGLRHNVGGDWWAYVYMYEAASESSFWDALEINDPGYMALNWISAQVNGGVYLVNLMIAMIGMAGILHFLRREPYPVLGFVAAVPYLLVVVSMGYSRQAAAIGVMFFALVAIADRKTMLAICYFILAALFHKTAIVFMVLVVFAFDKISMLRVLLVVGAVILGFVVMVWGAFSAMWQAYVLEQMESGGGLVRNLMLALPAVVLIFYRRRLLRPFPGERMWLVVALMCLGALLLVYDFTTFVDRFLLYLTPVALIFFARLPILFQDGVLRAYAAFFTVMLHALVLFVWLNFATHAPSWVPYQMWPWVD